MDRPADTVPSSYSVRVETKAADGMALLLAAALGLEQRGTAVPFVYPIRFLSEAAASTEVERSFAPRGGCVALHESQLIKSTRALSPGEELVARVEISPVGDGARLSMAVVDATKAQVAELTTRIRFAPVSNLLAARSAGRSLAQRGPVVGAFVSAPLTAAVVGSYAELSGDPNPIHTDPHLAKSLGLPERVVHGMLLVGLMETSLAAVGLRGRLSDLRARFLSPVLVGERVCVTVIEHPSSKSLACAARVFIDVDQGPTACLADAVLSA